MSKPSSPPHAPVWNSFRDPDGFVTSTGDGPNIVRQLNPCGMEKAQVINALPSLKTLQHQGRWIKAVIAPQHPGIVLHPRVFFPSYAHEWCHEMLHRAALVTLDVNLALLDDGWELKDATPSNVLFEGVRPVFVDHMSPAQRTPSQLGWRAYGQFVRNFLIPMMLKRLRHIPLSWSFLSRRDGVPPEVALPLLGMWHRWRPVPFKLITAPAMLARWTNQGRHPNTASSMSPEISIEVTRSIMKGLKKLLTSLAPENVSPSYWFNYQDLGISYSAEAMDAKVAFLREALRKYRPVSVLDLGCNTGKFSILAAEHGARVVALDSDPECVNRLFRESEAKDLDLQPLVMDLGRPSPRLGWGSQESKSLQDRIEGSFEMTFALAIVHHLLVRERIPLGDILDFILGTTTRQAVIEWVPPTDPQFLKMAGETLPLYKDLTIDQFIQALPPSFQILDRLDLPRSERTLLLLGR
ncbi:nodulation protein NoeA [Geothrix limicola]|uniref:Nodulation protein NoeA n=1 Tax=Geothrix limicola TaxID=2927978 RepID=A0ABQ5QLH6_9BACT|nr:class I SAM-dependent methyltransferase [Geothrix limicola]GLH75075.1 nodulation protein NoeA [Geothrix limicola]